MVKSERNIFTRSYWVGTLDARPLALFRILFGLLLLKDALYHIPLATYFYSDNGVLPRQVLLNVTRVHRFSLLDALSQPWMVQAFFFCWVACAFCLTIGYKTNWAKAINFILILSVQERNPFVNDGADDLMRLLSFWILFAPIAHAYSVDRWLQADKQTHSIKPSFINALPVRIMQVQIALVYICATLFKLVTEIETWRMGLGTFYALQLKNFTLPFGDSVFVNAPEIFFYITSHSTLIIEGAFCFFVFLPVLQPRLKAVGLFLGAGLHLTIAILMSIPNFSMVMIISYVLFFEPAWVIRVESLARSAVRYVGALFGINRLGEPPIKEHSPPFGESEDVAPENVWRLRSIIDWVSQFIAVICLVAVIWWNLTTIEIYELPLVPHMPTNAKSVMQVAGLYQKWSMFSPQPPKEYGWITVPGKFEDGTSLDLMTGEPIDDVMTRYFWGPSARMKKYEENLIFDENGDVLRGALAKYYCRAYNIETVLPEGEQLATLEIHYKWRDSVHIDEPRVERPLQDKMLWKHWCFAEYEY